MTDKQDQVRFEVVEAAWLMSSGIGDTDARDAFNICADHVSGFWRMLLLWYLCGT